MNPTLFSLMFLFLSCLPPSMAFANFWTVSAKISYFSPASGDIRKIYGNAFVDYQIELTRNIFCDWEVWMDLDFYTQDGSVTKHHHSTRLQVIPLSAGLKYYVYLRPNIYWYVGGGGCYTNATIHNHSKGLKSDINKWGFGGIFKTGIKYYWNNCLYFDFFLDYFYQHFRLHGCQRHSYPTFFSRESSSDCPFGNSTLNVGGTKIGAGIGWTF